VASIVDGQVTPGPVEAPDVVVEGDPVGIYYMFVEGRRDLVSIGGDHELLGRLLDVSPRPVEEPVGI
jgi:hypothetical protein